MQALTIAAREEEVAVANAAMQVAEWYGCAVVLLSWSGSLVRIYNDAALLSHGTTRLYL